MGRGIGLVRLLTESWLVSPIVHNSERIKGSAVQSSGLRGVRLTCHRIFCQCSAQRRHIALVPRG
jgi:hypothetical protein